MEATRIVVKLPWELLEIPKYKEGVFGEWELKQQKRIQRKLTLGYFGLRPWAGPNYYLRCNGRIWMSLTPMELESQAMFLDYAEGHTVVVGGGMGVILYNIMKKESVTKVTLVEVDPEIIKLLYAIGIENWPGYDKLTVFMGDLTEDHPVVATDAQFVYVDIWPTLNEERAVRDTQKIHRCFPSSRVGFWGQELDFIAWASRYNLPIPWYPRDGERYLAEVGLPLVGFERPDYMQLIFLAGQASVQMLLAGKP